MSTPTDPYSRPDHEDGNDDILDPLPEREASSPGLDGAESSVDEQDHAQADESTAPLQRETSLPSDADSETESTRSWRPDFLDDDPTEEETKPESDRERWEREFGSREDVTVRRPDETVTVPPAESRAPDANPDRTVIAPTSGTGSYPTRTSVFRRPPDQDEDSPFASTPPDAPRSAVFPADRDFGHTFEEPIPEEPRSRAWAHVGVFFATLLLAPLAWYLVADAGVRLSGMKNSAWNTGTVDWIVVLELLGALLCLAVLWFVASFSSLGPIIIGAIIAIVGLVAIFAPTIAQDVLQSTAMQDFTSYNDFTSNVGYHLTNDLASGRFAVFGFLLLMTGVVSHKARQLGAERGEAFGRRDVLLARRTDS
ncbi:hypothetical protein [Flaviflexus huanghaiensis]|uniref:hypothetical protein n=1 Tax=Flaviflexus huanghaiensis TaxID=1111473 RepID=UPI0015F8AAB6|nr:hypothetical protein [Flaviflexus huanghaiensis]